MGLKVVHINKIAIIKDAEAKAMWENTLKPKWDEQARARGKKLAAELKRTKISYVEPKAPEQRG
jgi:hypothetical protein